MFAHTEVLQALAGASWSSLTSSEICKTTGIFRMETLWAEFQQHCAFFQIKIGVQWCGASLGKLKALAPPEL